MVQSDVMFNASEARTGRIREQQIHDEVRAVENAILQTVRSGFITQATVNGTYMTNATTFGPVEFVIPGRPVLDAGHHLWISGGFPFNTGAMVTLQSSGQLPSPLQSGVIYYVIYVDQEHINLATTYDNAIALRPAFIWITDPGTGTHTLTQYLDSYDYYKVWQNQIPVDPRAVSAYQDRMNAVLKYFTNLGYNMNQVPNPATGNTFSWQISW